MRIDEVYGWDWLMTDPRRISLGRRGKKPE